MDGQELSGPRRSVRIPGFHYAQTGAYFVTICAYQKHCLFGSVRDDIVELTPLGRVVAECWTAIPQHFPHADVAAHVVMPNHVHGIIVLHCGARPDQEQPEAFQKPVAGSIPTILRTFKAAVTLHAKRSGIGPPHSVWQADYFERVLRSGKQYADAMRYVLENPMRWKSDEDNPQRSGTPRKPRR